MTGDVKGVRASRRLAAFEESAEKWTFRENQPVEKKGVETLKEIERRSARFSLKVHEKTVEKMRLMLENANGAARLFRSGPVE